MAQNKVTIHFEGKGSEKLRREIQKLAQVQNELLGETKKSNQALGAFDTTGRRNAKTMGGMANAFATVRSKMLLFNFAMGLGVSQLIRFTQEATKVEDMGRAFSTLQGGASNASIAIDKLQKATNGTMTQFNLFQQANNAMILGVTKNSDEMAEMFDVAQRLGQALGRDTASSVESLITGIGRQSRLMLDNIGIIVKSDEAYEDYAEKLGTTADKLTDAEKKQAFFEATMESARQKVALLGDEELSNSQKLAKMTVAINDATIALGQALMPLVMPLAKAMELLARVATSVFEAFNMVKESQLSTSEELDIARFHLESLQKAYEDAGGKMVEFMDTGVMTFQSNTLAAEAFVNKIIEAEAEVARLEEKFIGETIEDPFIKLSKILEDINGLFEEMELKSKKAGDAAVLAAIKSGAAYKNTGLAAQDAMEKETVAIAQAVIARYINSVFADMTLPFPVKLVLSAGAGAAAGSLLQGAIGQAKKMKFEQGGLVGGRRHSQGGTMIEAEQGEFVMSRRAVQSVGIETMNRINQGGGAGGVNISFSGNVMSQDFIEDEAIPMIKEAIRRGADIGVS